MGQTGTLKIHLHHKQNPSLPTHLLMSYQQQSLKLHYSKITNTEAEITEGGQKPRYTKDVTPSAM